MGELTLASVPWHRDPVVLERIVHAALEKRDVEGFRDALLLLAVVAPRRADEIREEVSVGLRIAAARVAEPAPSPKETTDA